MNMIISTSELQKHIGSLSQDIDKNQSITVVKNGKAKMVILPYFENNDDLIADYLEELEIQKNYSAIQKSLVDSKASGLSDFTI